MSYRALSYLLAASVGAAACGDPPAYPVPESGSLQASVAAADAGRYLFLFAAERVPVDFDARVAELGGRVEMALDPIGVAAVSGLTESAAAELAGTRGVRYVEPDAAEAPTGDHGGHAEPVAELSASHDGALTPMQAMPAAPPRQLPACMSENGTGTPVDAAQYCQQWNLRAVYAREAWEAGHLGSADVVVAILDSGIDYEHPDLAGRVDLSRSTSFVPDQDARVQALFPGRHPVTDLHGHGTASAGLVVSNASVLAGMTQRTTLIGVKTQDGANPSPLSARLAGVVYAADQGADVIHLAFNATFMKSLNPGLVSAVQRAVNYAHRKGAVLVTFAGNTAAALNVPGGEGDYDSDEDRFRLCNAAHVICVAATGPVSAGGLHGPWEDVDQIAPYSHFGRSAIDVAAPGGTRTPQALVPERAMWLLCAQTASMPGTRFATCRARGALTAVSVGTSWSAAMTSGLAALLVARYGKGNPALIRERILQSADDLGEPGLDLHYGRGRINMARALDAVP